MGSGSFIKVVAKNFDVLAGPMVTLVYPLLPFWSYAKLIFTCWLVLPYFSGAAYVYEHFVRPLFVNHQTVNIWYVPRKKDILGKSDDVLQAAERYIEENGPEAFEKLISKSERVSKSKKSKSRSILEEVGVEHESKPSNSNSYSIFDDPYRY